MQFQILDEKRYPLRINSTLKDMSPVWRFEHRVTLGYNTREFMVFIDNLKSSAHIEEITGGHLEQVKDDILHEALSEFAKERGYLDLMLPLMKDSSERYI
jgi:hypothetical protein